MDSARNDPEHSSPLLARIAVEGLPGAGKSTLAQAISLETDIVEVIPEVLVPLPGDPTTADFVRNDRAKGEAMRQSERAIVVLDRYWASTAAYVIAEQRIAGASAGPAGLIRRTLFGDDLPEPDLWIFLDVEEVIQRPVAQDRLWPNRAFRGEVHVAYGELFADITSPVLTVKTRLPDTSIAMRALRAFAGFEWSRLTSQQKELS